MSPSKTPKRVAFNCKEQVIISDMDEGEENCQSSATLSSNEEEETPPPVESNNNNSSSSSSSSSSSFSSSTIAMRKELLRLESLVRCHVQHQWHLSIENYSKLRKRQSSALSTPDAEAASTSPSSDCSTCPHNGAGDPGSPASIAQFNKEVQDAWSAIDFGQKPSLWRKTIRSVILRLRGQEQHKDVYVMPQHLRDQLKQMYVY